MWCNDRQWWGRDNVRIGDWWRGPLCQNENKWLKKRLGGVTAGEMDSEGDPRKSELGSIALHADASINEIFARQSKCRSRSARSDRARPTPRGGCILVQPLSAPDGCSVGETGSFDRGTSRSSLFCARFLACLILFDIRGWRFQMLVVMVVFGLWGIRSRASSSVGRNTSVLQDRT